jgi:phage repressor protein C with HTH and peptisase S24 domain
MSKSRTITDRILQFQAYKGLSDRKFCETAGLSSTYLATLKNGTEPGISQVQKILSAFTDLSDVWVYTEQGNMLKAYSSLDKTVPTIIEEVALPIPSADVVSIPIVDIKAAAGGGFMNTSVVKATDFIQLPPHLAKSGKYLCIRVKGASMSPTLQDGGFVIIRLLEKGEWKDLVSDRVYVVVDTEEKTYLKRVRNRFNSGFIVLSSDNPDKATYPNFNLQHNELVSIWYVEWYLSAKLPNIHDQFYSRLERLENTIEDMTRRFDELDRIELKTKKP